jgi:hypothetical protein
MLILSVFLTLIFLRVDVRRTSSARGSLFVLRRYQQSKSGCVMLVM